MWSFYEECPGEPFPYRRRGIADFGASKFGVHPDDAGFRGRRVDLISRSIKVGRGGTTTEAIRHYLREGKTASARALAQKGVVLPEPARERGLIISPRVPGCCGPFSGLAPWVDDGFHRRLEV